MKLHGVCNHTFSCCMAPMTCSYTSYCSGSCPVHEVGSSKRSRSLVQKPSSHDHEVMGRLCQQANIVAIGLLDSWPDVCEGPHNTEHTHPNQSAKDHTTTNIITRHHHVSNTLYNRTSWTTQHALSSDHLPIITTINIRHDYRLQQNRQTFTNYKKADWTQFTEDTESAFAQTTIPTNIHTANRIFTDIILMADKHNIPKT